MAHAKKTFSVGDLVRYTAQFLRSTGQVSGGPIDGIVVGHNTQMGGSYPIVLWSHRDLPVPVAAGNIERPPKSKAPQTREYLLTAARGTVGIPIGKPGAFRIYAGRSDKLKLQSEFQDRREAILRAELIYDVPGTGHVIVLDPDGSVITSLNASSGGGEIRDWPASSNPKKRGSRKPNSHDPDRSTKNFIAAMEAAERELGDANDALGRNQIARSVNHLTKAAYWLGQARVERSYARSVGTKLDARLKELEKNMLRWGNDLQAWIRKAA